MHFIGRNWLMPFLLFCLVGCFLAQQVRAEEPQPTPAEESKEFGTQDLLKELGNLFKNFDKNDDQKPHRFQLIKVDHDRARAEYVELLKLIPREEQLKFPGIENQKNAFPAIKAAREKFVKLADIYEDPEAGETQEYVDYLFGEAEETTVPWEKDEDVQEVKRWLEKNQPYTQAITKAINEADYCSRLAVPGLVYDEKLDDFDFETNRECMGYLTHRLHYHCRMMDWKAAVAEFELMVRYCELTNKSPGIIIDYMLSRPQVISVCTAAERMIRQPEFPAPQIAKILDGLSQIRKSHRPLADYIEFESQRYTLAKIAQIPLFQNVRDQIPALHLICYREQPPKNVMLEEDTDKNKFNLEFSGYYCLLLERAASALADHPRPFDKAETVRLLWADVKTVVNELRRHDYPHAKQTFAEKPTEELELLNQDKAKAEAILFPSQSSRTPLPALPEKLVKELRDRFQKQTNPLGRLYLGVSELSASRDRLLLAPASEEFISATIIKVACQLYELNLKHRPQVLDDLVKQGYLKEVPRSHYTGEPFGYDAVRGIFWRTGKQGTENGFKPTLKADEIDLGETGYGIQRLISAPQEEED